MEHLNKAVPSNSYSHDLSNIDWKEVVIGRQGEGIKIIEHLAERRFNRGPLAEESVNYVLEKLSHDNWQLCSSFKGNANAKTFVRRIIVNLLEEFSRKRFGRPRPPAWIQRKGGIWVKLWKELYLERQLLPSLIDRYASQGLYEKSWIQTVATIIKARIPSCGQANLEAICVEDIVGASNQAIMENRHSPLQSTSSISGDDEQGYDFELSAQAEIILTLQAIMEEPLSSTLFQSVSTNDLEDKAQSYNDRFKQLTKEVELSDEETILLRMVYRDGLSRTAAAKALGLNNYQTNVLLNKTLKRMRTAIEGCGIDLESLLVKMQH